MMRKIECFLKPSKLDKARAMILKKGVEGMSVTEARGFGSRSNVKKGVPQFEKRIKIEIVVHERIVDDVLSGLKSLAGAGEVGAGKIFVLPVEDAIRLSTKEHGQSALI